MTLANDQVGTREDGKVRRHRVLEDSYRAGQLPGWNTFGLAFHQKPKGFQAGNLRQCAQSDDCTFLSNHTPSLADFITATSGFELSVHTPKLIISATMKRR